MSLASAKRALELEPSLGEAYAALSTVSFLIDWDWQKARREMQKALELSPESSWVHWGNAFQLTALGRHDEAIEAMKHARSLDPFNPYINACVGEMYWFAGRHREAEGEWRRVAERHPHYSRPHYLFQLMYQGAGEYEKAIAAKTKLAEIEGSGAEAAASLRDAYRNSGGEGYWQWWLDVYSATDRIGPHVITAYARAGEKDRAVELLEQAFENRNGHMAFLKVSPAYDMFRDDARFEAIVRSMNFP